MPSAATIRDDLDAAMDSNDPLYGASSLRTATKETLLQSLGDVLGPLIGSGAHIAATAPTVNDDSGDGYGVGDRWIDTSAGNTYTLVDATLGAAVWVQENGGGGGGAPTTADYLVKTANGSLSAERVVTDTASVTWDWGTAGQAKATVPDASTSAKGIVELATSAETTAGLVVQASDTRLSDSRAPSGAAGGDLDGTYPNPSVAAVTETSGPTSLAIGAIGDGMMVQRSGASLVGTYYVPIRAYWDTGATTSSSTGVHAGPDVALDVGTYRVFGCGSQSSSAAATGVRPFLAGSGGLAVSSYFIEYQMQYSATDAIQGQTLTLGGIPLIGNGSTTRCPYFFVGFLTVTTPGTLEVWVASEGTNNVTLNDCLLEITRFA